jgi:signal transduction histidine kinase
MDLAVLVEETIEFMSGLAVVRDVKLTSFVAQRLLMINGDRVQLQQVLINLIVNAMDAMSEVPSGAREVSIHARRSDNFATVSVSDVGPGISPENLNRVFEPFFTTKSNGMGMGLSIARTIVEIHGGTLYAESKTGRGAIFSVKLPLASVAE